MQTIFNTSSQEAFKQSIGEENKKDIDAALELKKRLSNRIHKHLTDDANWLIEGIIADIYSTHIENASSKLEELECTLEMEQAIELFIRQTN